MTNLEAPKIIEDDQISELPDELLVLILSRLTSREAARTSLISKRWRYVWMSISVLNFDTKLNNASYSYNPPGSYIYCLWVYHVLRKHRGLSIDELRICYDLDKDYWSYLDGWIRTGLQNRISSLYLDLSYDPSSLECFPSRRACYVAQPWIFEKFNSLKTLSLNAITLDHSIIEYLLHSCPLERLSIRINVALTSLKVIGQSLKLKHLEVGRCWRLETIEISDTNLVSFTYDGSLLRVILNNVPRLVEVSVKTNFYTSIAHTIFPRLSCNFPQLRILRLTVYNKEMERLSHIMLPEQKNLKEFVLFVGGPLSADSLLRYLAIIKSFPNLQRFVFKINCRPLINRSLYEERKDITEDVREAAKFCHPNLKQVKITGYCNTYDSDVFKQIIENAVNLEKIIIDSCHPEDETKRKKDNDDELQSSLEQRLRAQLSPGVELVLS